MKLTTFSILSLIAAPALAAEPFFPVANSDSPYMAVGVVLNSEVPPFNPTSEAYSAKVLVVAGLNPCDASSSVKSLASQDDTQGKRSVLKVDVSNLQNFACTEAFQPVYQELSGYIMRWKDQPIVFGTNTKNFGEVKMLKNDDAVVVASDSFHFSGARELVGKEVAWRVAEFDVAAFAGNNSCEARNVQLKPYSYIIDGVMRVGVEQQIADSLTVCPDSVAPVFKTVKFVAAFPVGGVNEIVLENVGEMGRVQKYGTPEQMR